MTTATAERPAAPTATPLAVSLSMNQETHATIRRNEGAVALAESFVIDSPDMAEEAVRQIQTWRGATKKLDDLYKGFVEPAKSIVERAKELFNPARKAIEDGDAILRAKLQVWNQDQQRIADEERARAETAAREARQKAEREAAAARATAEAKAADERRRADEARAAQEAAVAAGNVTAAREAAERAARAEANATAALENGEAKAAVVTLEAAATMTVVAAPAVAKGFGQRANWKAECVADEAATIKALVGAIAAGRTDLLAILAIDTKAADRMAAALKLHFNVPGMKAVNRPSSVVRAAT
jgi:ATPase subunit of ABC transporter with duplicated ATPase domains